MRRVTVIMAVIIVLFLFLMAAGCGNKEQAESPGSDRRASDDTSEPEEIFVTITEDEIGVPIYPGALAIESLLLEGSNAIGECDYKYSSAELSTDDTVEEVTDWYREALSGKPGFEEIQEGYSAGDAHVFSFDASDCCRMIIVMPSDDFRLGLTLIVISSEYASFLYRGG